LGGGRGSSLKVGEDLRDYQLPRLGAMMMTCPEAAGRERRHLADQRPSILNASALIDDGRRTTRFRASSAQEVVPRDLQQFMLWRLTCVKMVAGRWSRD
jgi:hypothetical protein